MPGFTEEAVSIGWRLYLNPYSEYQSQEQDYLWDTESSGNIGLLLLGASHVTTQLEYMIPFLKWWMKNPSTELVQKSWLLLSTCKYRGAAMIVVCFASVLTHGNDPANVIFEQNKMRDHLIVTGSLQ